MRIGCDLSKGEALLSCEHAFAKASVAKGC